MLTPARLRAVRAAAHTIKSRPISIARPIGRPIISISSIGRRWNTTQAETVDEEEPIRPFVDTRNLKAYHGMSYLAVIPLC